MGNTNKTTAERTKAAAARMARVITALRKEDPELARWLAEDISRSLENYRDATSGIARKVG